MFATWTGAHGGLFREAARGLSFWLDGVAAKWDRSASLDMLTISIPELTWRWRNLRVSLCVVDHSHVTRHKTWDDILTVALWSLDHLSLHVRPTRRHDKDDWTSCDVECLLEAQTDAERQTAKTDLWRNQRLDHWCVIPCFHSHGLSVCPLL